MPHSRSPLTHHKPDPRKPCAVLRHQEGTEPLPALPFGRSTPSKSHHPPRCHRRPSAGESLSDASGTWSTTETTVALVARAVAEGAPSPTPVLQTPRELTL